MLIILRGCVCSSAKRNAGEALVADRQANCICAHTWYVSCVAQSSVHPLTKSLPQHLQPCASLYALATMHFLLPANGFCMYLQIPRPSRARSTELCCPLRHVSQTADAAESSETGNWRKSEEIGRSCRDIWGGRGGPWWGGEGGRG